MSGARDVTVILEPTRRFSVITPRMAPRKDDPYDCISMQQGPATEKGLVNAEMLAALPHKKQADPPQDTSAIYTFLGLATLPRLGKALAAAANPMTVAEHVEAGTLKVGRRDPNVPAELYGDDRSDLSDFEDY